MNGRSTAIAIGIIVCTYIWLGYSMIVLRNPMLTMIVYYLAFCLGCGLLIRKFTERDKVYCSRNQFKSPVLFTFTLCLIAAVILWLCTLLFRPGIIDPAFITDGLDSIGMTRDSYWIPAGFLAIVNPFAEEFLWRASVFRFFSSKMKISGAVIISSLIFAGYHPLVISMIFPPVWLALAFVITFIGGIFLAHLYMRTRSIAYPIALHLVINVNLMLMGYNYSLSSTP